MKSAINIVCDFLAACASCGLGFATFEAVLRREADDRYRGLAIAYLAFFACLSVLALIHRKKKKLALFLSGILPVSACYLFFAINGPYAPQAWPLPWLIVVALGASAIFLVGRLSPASKKNA